MKLTKEQESDEAWFIERLLGNHEPAGTIVETKLGKGITKNSDKPVNGKILVYLDNGSKMLIKPENLKLIGYYD